GLSSFRRKPPATLLFSRSDRTIAGPGECAEIKQRRTPDFGRGLWVDWRGSKPGGVLGQAFWIEVRRFDLGLEGQFDLPGRWLVGANFPANADRGYGGGRRFVHGGAGNGVVEQHGARRGPCFRRGIGALRLFSSRSHPRAAAEISKF